MSSDTSLVSHHQARELSAAVWGAGTIIAIALWFVVYGQLVALSHWVVAWLPLVPGSHLEE